MKRGLRQNIAVLLTVFCGLILIVWALVYLLISNRIYSDARDKVELTAGQLLDNLSGELMDMEQLSFSLSHHSDVIRFATETELSEYYALADQVAALLDSSRYDPAFAGHVMIYNKRDEVYRFAGSLSNTSCSRVSHVVEGMSLPGHLVIRQDGNKLIGYANGIYSDDGERVGALVMLIEEERILELIQTAAPGETLNVALTAQGETIVTNGLSASGSVAYRSERHVGLTPFEIEVSADRPTLLASTSSFTIPAALTFALFVALVVVFVRILNQRFFRPILQVMSNVEALDADAEGNRLEQVQSVEFDRLIANINDMLERLDRKNAEVRTAELRLKNAELQRQKAIIFSLKKQISAHFVINTLNTILILMEQGDLTRAREITTGLSALVRYAYDEDEMINAWDEFRVLAQYIEIMNARYADRIEVVFELDDRLMDMRMPRMLLQPIVENAIQHGMNSRLSGCVIEITAALHDGRIVICVRDNGCGMDAASLAALHRQLETDVEHTPDGIENIALLNIKRQLLSYYGGMGRMEIESEYGTGTSVTLTLPSTSVIDLE